jgi:hypothetical protein
LTRKTGWVYNNNNKEGHEDDGLLEHIDSDWEGTTRDLTTLVGLVLTEVTVSQEQHILVMRADDGRTFALWHIQDCCEHVTIEDITGDLQDLIGTPIVVAEETSNRGDDYEDGTSTWTFSKS